MPKVFAELGDEDGEGNENGSAGVMVLACILAPIDQNLDYRADDFETAYSLSTINKFFTCVPAAFYTVQFFDIYTAADFENNLMASSEGTSCVIYTF